MRITQHDAKSSLGCVNRVVRQWVSRSRFLIALIIFSIMFVGVVSLNAATLCVNPGGSSGCFALPSAAVAAAAANDVIVIHPGTYQESGTINITKALKISGDNPMNTTVTNSVPQSVFTVIAGSGALVEISGLKITGGGSGGILVSTGGSITLHHNNIVFNSGSGISTGRTTDGSFTAFGSIVAYNNVVFSNNGNGIACCTTVSQALSAYNNIVAKNGGTGISGASASYNSSFSNGANGTSNYNLISGNIGNLTLDCLFVGTTDYRLQPTSQCKDAGNPGIIDVDGTRSDMGSFGGPTAAAFWPYGNGGPVITDLTIDPVIVPRGGTISINATGEIR